MKNEKIVFSLHNLLSYINQYKMYSYIKFYEYIFSIDIRDNVFQI